MMNRVFRMRYIVMVLVALISLSSPAIAQQAKKKSVQKRTTTTSNKSAGAKKSSGKKTTTKKTTTAKQPVTVNSLKNEQQRVRKQIEEQQRKLKANERYVKKRHRQYPEDKL